MIQISLTIGHNVNNIPTLDTVTICRNVTETLGVSAYTAIPCFGMWEGVAENSTRIEIVTDDSALVTDIVSRIPVLCAVLMQDAIMVNVDHNASVSFISRESVAA